jgi:hypothetical protein
MMEVTRRQGRRRKQLLVDLKEKETIPEIEKGFSRSHCVENWLLKRLWTCRETDTSIHEIRACVRARARVGVCVCVRKAE